MPNEKTQEADLMFVIRHIILMEAILIGITILLAIVGGILLILDVQPLATGIDAQIQIILQNPIYGILLGLGYISLGIGGILCFPFGFIEMFQSPTEISSESYARLKPHEAKQLHQARSWMPHSANIFLGICFIVHGILLFIISGSII